MFETRYGGSSFGETSRAYVYQIVACINGCLRDIDEHLSLIGDATMRFWNRKILLDKNEILEAALDCIHKRGGSSSNTKYFLLRVFKDGDFDVEFLYNSIYESFTLKALRQVSKIVRSYSPLFQYPTSALYEHSQFLKESLQRSNVHVPVCVDYKGNVTHIDSHSPIVILNRKLFYTPTMEEVELKYFLEKIQNYGIECQKTLISEEMFMRSDEAMYVNEDGVSALKRCEDHVFGDIIVDAVYYKHEYFL